VKFLETKIISKNEQPIFSRTKVDIELIFEKQTPSNKEVKGAISKALGADEKLISLQGIYTNFGERKSKCTIYLYSDPESMRKIEDQLPDKVPGKGSDNTGSSENAESKKIDQPNNQEKK
jgi:ribosomal protein S24E